ncbi:hypothetical protein BDP27DRAFT_1232880, partial [Rhodocollybia butyracea]
GTMTQAGLNMGARDCRVFGRAKSFTKKLTAMQMIDHDRDIIGAVSVFCSLAQAVLPTDVMSAIHNYMDNENLPNIQTRNIEPGNGFKLCVEGKDFFFPYADRAPPEVYINSGYAVSVLSCSHYLSVLK